MEPLGDCIHDMYPKFGSLTIPQACQVGIELVKSVRDLHLLGYLHKDLKLDNIMIRNKVSTLLRENSKVSMPDLLSKEMNRQNGVIKLIDFSLV